MLEMMGYKLEEMVGQPVWKFIMEEELSREAVLGKLAGTIPPSRNLERTFRRKDGTTFPVLIEDRIIHEEKGQTVGIRATLQDITKRKYAEEEMAALKDQLHQAQRMEAIGQLAGGFAHDFNNALTLIKASYQLALFDLKEGDPLREKIEMILGATDRSANLAPGPWNHLVLTTHLFSNR